MEQKDITEGETQAGEMEFRQGKRVVYERVPGQGRRVRKRTRSQGQKGGWKWPVFFLLWMVTAAAYLIVLVDGWLYENGERAQRATPDAVVLPAMLVGGVVFVVGFCVFYKRLFITPLQTRRKYSKKEWLRIVLRRELVIYPIITLLIIALSSL